jgi:hypothetical protein
MAVASFPFLVLLPANNKAPHACKHGLHDHEVKYVSLLMARSEVVNLKNIDSQNIPEKCFV